LSFQSFLASDLPLAEVENPHIKLLSVNEAIEMGVALPGLVLNSKEIDHNQPGVILWADSEESLGNITIHHTEKTYLGRDDSRLDTELQYFSTLEWRYTYERAETLIAYIREHLQNASAVEVWNLWVGYEETVPNTRKHRVCVLELSAMDLEKMYNLKNQIGWQQYDCLMVTRGQS